MKKKFTIFVFIFTLLFSVTNLDVLAASKAPTIEQLQKKITELTKQVKNLTTKLSTKTKEATKLVKENTTLHNQIKSKDDTIMSKESEIGILKDTIEDKNKTIELQNERIRQFEQLNNAEIVYTDRYLNAGNDVKWYKFRTSFNTIYLTQKAFEKYNYIINLSDRLLSDVGGYYGITKMDETVSTYIWYENEVTMSEEDSLSYNDRLKRVYIDASRIYPARNTTEDFVSVYVHEHAHVFQTAIFTKDRTNIVTWLHEGVPDYVDNQFLDYEKYGIPSSHLRSNGFNKDNFKDAIIQNLEYNNEPMLTKLPTKRFVAYQTYQSFIYYLENTYGHKKFLEFLKDAHKNQNINEVLKNHFGIDEYQLIKEWKNYFSLN
ncbi:hypothetical protein ACFSO7_02565 [Bacillus sp. CGMCC 1.16607]|uniref:hypothetical protein n=1 Tax=Bacillus sp. CGMCC 1.16607 TaxID=3351842 RepID=UPI0036326D50